jgi:hypothetical protein
MAHFSDWIPSREQDLVDLIAKWILILGDAVRQALYGWIQAACVAVIDKMEAFLAARNAYAQVNSTENRVAKDEAKTTAVEAMREFARESIRFNKKVDDETRVFLGLRIVDNVRSTIPTPQAQCTGKITNPGIHLVEVELTGYAILTADQRANYGVRVYWGIVPQGEVTVGMASGAKHYLAKPPETGEVLGNSVFTRKKKHVFDFDGDSGNRVFFCCRFENGKGDSGPFGPIISAIIT